MGWNIWCCDGGVDCIALKGNSDLVAAFWALSADCPESEDNKVDFASCSATGKFQLACTAAGGKTFISQLKAVWLVFITIYLKFTTYYIVELLTFIHLYCSTMLCFVILLNHKGNPIIVPSASIMCSANGNEITILFSNLPVCIGISCEESVVESEPMKERMARLFEQELAGK